MPKWPLNIGKGFEAWAAHPVLLKCKTPPQIQDMEPLDVCQIWGEIMNRIFKIKMYYGLGYFFSLKKCSHMVSVCWIRNSVYP